jgi:methyl coenzyme M reductase subunit C
MRNLRQLLSRFGTASSRERLRRGQRSSLAKSRRALTSESLEKRELLAGDILFAHNYLNPADVDDNMQITASDALKVINAISRSNGGGIEITEAGQVDGYMDVNGDGMVTASDALSVINAVSRGEAASAGVNLFLNLRDVNDAALTTANTRTATINTEEVVYLEVSYSDERTFGADIGAFQVVTDILVDQADVLTPVVTDTDEINIESTLRSATSGTATFSLDDGTTNEVTLTLAELSDLDQAIKNAVVTLGGYDPDTIIVTPLQGEPLGRFDGQVTPTPSGDSNFQFRIRYNDFDLANQDLPDLQVSFDMDVTVRSEVVSTSPLDENGNIRGSAVGLNLDTRSRTAPSASPFGREIYNSLTLGTYIADDGNGGSLFDNFLAVGPLNGSGIEGAVPGFEEPFDTFSIPVRVNSAVENLTFSLGLAGGGDDFLLYGEEGDEAILTDNQIGFDPVLSTFTLNVVDPNGGGNNDPIVASAITETLNEDQADATINLLTGASDPDGDTLSISTPTITGDPQSGVSVNGTSLTVDPSAYNALNDGESQVVTVSYNVLDGNGGSVAQTATITITGITDVQPNQNPVVSAAITQTFNEDQAASTINLLTGASDPDGDTLSISTPTITGDPQSGVSVNGAVLTITPAAYGGLNDGESQVVTVSYNVLDGNGGSVAQTATVTITGVTDVVNQAPVVSAPIAQTLSEVASPVTVNLLSGASDPDGDPLSISAPTITGNQAGISVSGSTLTLTPTAYSGLTNGQSEVITLAYNVTDGNGGSTPQTATFTITGVNQGPDANDDSATAVRGVATTINVLANDNAGPAGEDQTLTVVAATSDQGDVDINPDGTLTFTATGSGAGTATINYTIEDSDGATDTALLTVVVTDFDLVTLSGSLFIDNIESNANPVRDGIKNGPDAGIGGIQVRLVNSTGTTVASALTSLNGDYSFTNVAPGNYTIVHDLPDTIRTLGSTTTDVVVDPNSSTAPTVPGLSVAGTQNTGLETINLLSSNYLRRNGSVADMSNGGLEGGAVSFDADGNQQLFIAGEGFEDVVFGEVILSTFGDSAVMVIVREGATAPEVATLDSEFFVQSSGGRSIQFFGGVDDFDFNPVDGEVGSIDLARYQAAVDRALSEL